MAEKITYTTLSADNEDLHIAFESAVENLMAEVGQTHPQYIGEEARTGRSTFQSTSPIDTNIVLGEFQRGTREDAQDAIAAARATYPAWRAKPWQERCDMLDKVADAIKDYKAGKVEFRNDAGGNVHAVVGKLSFDSPQLVDNIQAFIDLINGMKPMAVRGQYVKGIAITATMSPSVRVAA